MPNTTKPSLVNLVNETFGKWALGPLPADYTPRGEYMCQDNVPRADDWHDPINRTGHAGPKFESVWQVRQVAGKKALVQTCDAQHDPFLVATGRRDWKTAHAETTLATTTEKPCGLLIGYRHARSFFAIVLLGPASDKRLQVIQYAQDQRLLLADLPVKMAGKVRLGADYKPGRIDVTFQGKVLAKLDAPGLQPGGVGLLADGPCTFFKVSVKTTVAEKKRIDSSAKRAAAAQAKLRKEYPQPQKRIDISIQGISAGRQIRFGDLNGDGKDEILLAMPVAVRGQKWQYHAIACLTAIDLQGNVLWQIGKPTAEPLVITQDLPFQAADIDGDGQVEVVAVFGDKIQVIDGKTGRIKKSADTPVPPKMEPYWDEISQYWGDGHGDDLPRLIPDAVRLCNLTGKGPYGDLLLKDRYHNVWALDGATLQVLWQHQSVVGHFPFTSDINGDGLDECMLGYSRVDSKGNLFGRLVLTDHPDACFWIKMPNGMMREYHPAGEAGLVIHEPNGLFATRHLGHVQHLCVADFDPDHPGLEVLTVMYWGEPGIVYLCDLDGRVIRDMECLGLGTICQPTNWTGDGRELILLTSDTAKGGLYDGRFNRVVALPGKGRPTFCCEPRDVLGLGVDQIVVWDHDRLQVYAPDRLPRASAKRYNPDRPHVNQSNYMAYYSLPRWE